MSLAEHRARRQRLMNPPNAVPDTGITMRNGWPIDTRPKPNPHCAEILPFKPKPKLWPLDLCGEFWLSSELSFVPERTRPFISNVRNAVCAEWGISTAEIISKLRDKRLVVPRQVAMALSAKLTGKSLPEIGRRFHRDHTTVLHARKKLWPHIDAVAAELGEDAPVIEWAQAMKARLCYGERRA